MAGKYQTKIIIKKKSKKLVFVKSPPFKQLLLVEGEMGPSRIYLKYYLCCGLAT